MKPVFEKTDNDRNVILINKITTKHLIVGHNYRKEPIILTNEKFNTRNFKFTSINDLFTQSNSYNSFNSIKEVIEYYLDAGWNIEVFHQKDWKKALQWLIDNAK